MSVLARVKYQELTRFEERMDRDYGDLQRMGICSLSAVDDWRLARGRAELGPEILQIGKVGD